MQFIHQLPAGEPRSEHWTGDNSAQCSCDPHYRWWMLQPGGYDAWVTQHRSRADIRRTHLTGNVIV